MIDNTLPNVEELECPLGHKCSKCLWYRCMPVDVTDPTSGKVLRQGTVWDCLLAWNMMGAWDTGRQTRGVHSAVAQQTNSLVMRQDKFIGMLEEAKNSRRLRDANS